jgi:hypothetical protein
MVNFWGIYEMGFPEGFDTKAPGGVISFGAFSLSNPETEPRIAPSPSRPLERLIYRIISCLRSAQDLKQ